MGRRLQPRIGAGVLAILMLASGGPASALSFAKRALIVDYQMAAPVVLSALIERLKAAGFDPAYRPYYPRLTRKDLEESALVILMSGAGPAYPSTGMSPSALEPLETFVRGGGALILAPTSGGENERGGDHERYLFNLLLKNLDVPIRIQDDWVGDDENAYAAPLYRAPFCLPARAHPVTAALEGRMVTDRTPSLSVGDDVDVLLQTFPTAFRREAPSKRGRFVLAAMGHVGGGTVAVLSRFMLAWGGGHLKEPAKPLRPLAREEANLKAFLANLLAHLHDKVESKPHRPAAEAVGVSRFTARAGFPPMREPFPKMAPERIETIHAWRTKAEPKRLVLEPTYRWILERGIRSGWAYIDRDPGELDRLAGRMSQAGMNLLWGVGHPQQFTDPRSDPGQRAALLKSWIRLAEALSGSPVHWFVGMEVPGRDAFIGERSTAVGIEGRRWPIPSPWNRDIWRREVVEPARFTARFSKTHPAVSGIILDLEMYGRRPLYFSNGVDFGDAPFRAFLQAREYATDAACWKLGPASRFPWLRDHGLLKEYYDFLEKRAEQLGRELRSAVRSVNPEMILGCYIAGPFHRWFYRGLWRGMAEPGKPLVLFTFGRDVQRDSKALRAAGIAFLHVRALLMGTMRREDYVPLIRQSLSGHWGYWLNRLTSLVAEEGFSPIEAPLGLSKTEAWRIIGEANRAVPFENEEAKSSAIASDGNVYAPQPPDCR